MHARPFAIGCVLFASGALGGQPAPSCLVPGEPIHWIADWCMLTLQTDDEIAASDCIAQQRARRFASACAAKTHFKREMCRVMRAGDASAVAIDQCVADPAVVGRTVRNGGVGGR
jgi:hypothetical protein